MKLWSKDDGRAGEFGIDETKSFPYYVRDEFGNTYHTKTLKEIADKWEDYEEPKWNWYVDWNGEIKQCDKRIDALLKFETKEEAEKAVEKLKACKRLEEAGAEFYGWRRNQTGTYELYMRWHDRIPRSYEVKKDLDLLFSGGEE